MSNIAIQSVAVAVGAVAMFFLVFSLSRRGLLSLRYALGWIAVSAAAFVGALMTALIGGIGRALPFTPTGLIAAVGLGFLTLIALQLSVSLSGNQDAIRELAEAVALLEERLARIEEQIDPPAEQE
jgi:hypothetical protein